MQVVLYNGHKTVVVVVVVVVVVAAAAEVQVTGRNVKCKKVSVCLWETQPNVQ